MSMRRVRSLLTFKLGLWVGFCVAALFVKKAVTSRGDEGSDEVALVAIFDGIELRSRARAFRGGSLLAWFGGIVVDLRDAELAAGARLSVRTLCGGVQLQVPAWWRVQSRVHVLLGGVNVPKPTVQAEEGPVLVIDGLAVLGGINVSANPGAAFAHAR
jgi:hypothetical protein